VYSEHLTVIAVTASNTWGLLLLVVLLGYGLVELPRHIWLMSTTGHLLQVCTCKCALVKWVQKTYFDIDKLSSDKNDAEETVASAYRDANDVLDALPANHPHREYAQTIIQKVIITTMYR
jgi:hypothetical protein